MLQLNGLVYTTEPISENNVSNFISMFKQKINIIYERKWILFIAMLKQDFDKFLSKYILIM